MADKPVKVGKLDATVYGQKAARFGASSYPTLKILPAGPKTENGAIAYEGGRDAASERRQRAADDGDQRGRKQKSGDPTVHDGEDGRRAVEVQAQAAGDDARTPSLRVGTVIHCRLPFGSHAIASAPAPFPPPWHPRR